MYRILGAVLIGLCSVYTGASLSGRLRQRAASVSALRDSFVLMRQKIACYRPPLPVLLREIAEEQAGMLSSFYARAASRLEQERRKTTERILTECLAAEHALEFPEEALRCCRRLFSSLGRLDAAEQESMLARLIEDLDETEKRMIEDVRRRGRCFCALGICGGLAVTILLV